MEKAIQGINSLAENLIYKGVPADIAYKVSASVEKGIKRKADQIAKTATEKLQAKIDKSVNLKKSKLHNLFDAL